MASSLVQRGVQKDFWPGSGVRGGCPGVGVGLCWWFKLVLALGCLPFALPPWCLVVRGGDVHHFCLALLPSGPWKNPQSTFHLAHGREVPLTSLPPVTSPTDSSGGGLLPRPLSHRLFRGGGASPAAPLPPPLPLSHNFCHRLRASRILAHRDKSHHFHSRGAHFPPGLKMRCAEGLISSSKG